MSHIVPLVEGEAHADPTDGECAEYDVPLVEARHRHACRKGYQDLRATNADHREELFEVLQEWHLATQNTYLDCP